MVTAIGWGKNIELSQKLSINSIFFQCEKEFREYIRDKTNLAKSNFKELLQECKLITHKSFDLYMENRNHLKEIEEILKNDKRYISIYSRISRNFL